jgi:hypothetical protein
LIATHPRISELKIDPPGADADFEFIELHGEPSTSLSGFYLVALEGDAESNLGQVDTLIDLSKCGSGPCGFDRSGSLVITADNSLISADTGASVRISSELSRGGLENGTATLLLIATGGPLRLGADWDADDDGRLELPDQAWTADAISWNDGDSEDRNYADSVLGPKPKVNAAWSCDDGEVRTWFFGQLSGDAGSLTLDPARTAPLGLVVSELTPGVENACALRSAGGASTSDAAGAAGVAGAAGKVGSSGGDASIATWTSSGGTSGSSENNQRGSGGTMSASTSDGRAPSTTSSSSLDLGGSGSRNSLTQSQGGVVATYPAAGKTSAVANGGTSPSPTGNGVARGGRSALAPSPGAPSDPSGGGFGPSAGSLTSSACGAAGIPLIVHGRASDGSGGSTWWTPNPVPGDSPLSESSAAGASTKLSSVKAAPSTAKGPPDVPDGCAMSRRARSTSGGLGQLLALLLVTLSRLKVGKLRRHASKQAPCAQSTAPTTLAPTSQFRYTRRRKCRTERFGMCVDDTSG